MFQRIIRPGERDSLVSENNQAWRQRQSCSGEQIGKQIEIVLLQRTIRRIERDSLVSENTKVLRQRYSSSGKQLGDQIEIVLLQRTTRRGDRESLALENNQERRQKQSCSREQLGRGEGGREKDILVPEKVPSQFQMQMFCFVEIKGFALLCLCSNYFVINGPIYL